MSMNVYQTHGCGMKLEQLLRTIKATNFLNFIQRCPCDIQRQAMALIKESHLNLADESILPAEDVILAFGSYEDQLGQYGFSAFFAEAISNMNHDPQIRFDVARDDEEGYFIMFTYSAPWSFNEAEKALTGPEEIQAILEQYVHIITDDPIPFQEYLVAEYTA